MLAGNVLIKVGTNVADVTADFNKMARSFETAANTIKGAMLGIGSIAVFDKWLEATKEAEQASKQVEAVLRSTHQAAGVTKKQVDDLSDSLSRLTGVDDDVIEGAQALMLTFTRVSKETFPDAMKAALDMSVALKTDLNSATMLVGKALNDPVKGMTALTKAGVSLSAGQKEVIKSLEETGHHSEAMAMILKELQTEFGGSAAAARDTLGGALTALGTNVENLTEMLGGPDGMRYAVELANEAVLEMQDGLKSLQDYFESGQAASSEWGKNLQAAGEFAMELGGQTLQALKGSINEIIRGFIDFGKVMTDVCKAGVDTFKLLVDAAQLAGKLINDALGAVGIKVDWKGMMQPFEEAFKQITDKGFKSTADDYVGAFFKPIQDGWEHLTKKTQENMTKMHEAAKNAGLHRTPTVDAGDVETKAQIKAREKLLKQIESEKKKVDEILAGYQLENQELMNKANKQENMNELLKAQQEIMKNQHLSIEQQNQALQKLFELDKQRQEIKKQMAVNKEHEELQQVLADLDQQNKQLVNTNNHQSELNVSLKAQAEIEKIIKEGKGQHLELVNQILAKAKEQEAILREQKRLEALTKFGDVAQDMADQNRQMQLKVAGQEQFLPLLEAEKKMRDVMASKDLSDADKSGIISQMQASAQQAVGFNQALEQQDRTLKAIKESSGSVTQRIAALQMAFADGRVNVKQYQDTLQDLQNEGFKNLKKDAKEFSDTLVGGLTKMFDKGTKFTDVLKQMGKQLLILGSKKLIEPLAERLFTGIGSRLFGGGYGLNKQNPIMPGFGSGGGGTVADTPTLPTTLAEGPTIVTLLQQIVSLMGGVPATGGTTLGALGAPFAGPSTVNYSQSGGGLMSRVGGFFRNLFNFGGGASNPLKDMLGSSGMSGGMPSSGGGGLFGALGGVGKTLSGGALGLLRALGTPFFAYGGFLGPGQWGVAGDRGPELIYGGQTGMSIIPAMGTGAMGFQAPWQQQNVYAGGRGGYSGNGMISQFDYANTMGDLMQAKYDSYINAVNNSQVPLNWYTAQELKAQADRFKQIVANNGYTGQLFSRAQFEMSSASADFNEAAYQWGGNRANVGNYIYNPAVMAGYNPNARMNSMSFGIASSGMGQGSSAGIDTGGYLPPGLREASYTIGNGYQPIISTGAGGVITQYQSNGMGGLIGSAVNSMGSAFSRLFNGGDLRTASQMGSYLGPLLRNGRYDVGATANIGGMYFTPGQLERFRMRTAGANAGFNIYDQNSDTIVTRRGDLGGYFQHAQNIDRGGWGAGGKFTNPNIRFGTGEVYGPWNLNPRVSSKLMPDMVSGLLTGSGSHTTFADVFAGQNYRFGGATQQSAFPLMQDLSDMMPNSVLSQLNVLKNGFEIINAANPAQFTARGLGQSLALRAGSAMLGGITSPNSIYSQMSAIMSQPWANKSMPFSSYPAAASLFGMRGFRTGGRPPVGVPSLFGEGGEELWVPDEPGTVVPHSRTRELLYGQKAPTVVVNTLTREKLKVEKRVDGRDVRLIISDIMDNVAQRPGSFRDRLISGFNVSPQTIRKS